MAVSSRPSKLTATINLTFQNELSSTAYRHYPVIFRGKHLHATWHVS